MAGEKGGKVKRRNRQSLLYPIPRLAMEISWRLKRWNRKSVILFPDWLVIQVGE
jgi:hypothetical protein